MSNLLKHLQSMYNMELYSNIIPVCSLMLTTTEQNSEPLTSVEKLQLLVIYANSLYHNQEYSQAEEYFRNALQIKKNLLKNKKDDQVDFVSDVELKYNIYQCCKALKHHNAAFSILQSISAKMRTPKINMALGNMYRDSGLERNAITCYREVLKECPLSLEAMENLLKLGVKGVEVNSLMMEVVGETNWLVLWLKAQAHLHSGDFDKALQNYKSMDLHGMLRDNPYLLVNMGYCYHLMCNEEKAIFTLQRAIRLNNNMIFGRDLLSTILAKSTKSEHINYLENLSTIDLDMSLWDPVHFIVLANYMLATKQYDKAILYARQSLLQKNNIEGLLAKARALVELHKYQDAANSCTLALQICPYRFDIHKCIVDIYIKMDRIREADSMALNACHKLNYSPQTLTLHASVLLKDPISSNKITKKILEKAVAHDKTLSTDAVCMLAEFLQQEQQYEQAKGLLLKYVDVIATSKIHQMLADCYAQLQKDEDAFHHYNIAVKLDPNNERATEGLNLSLNKKDSYYSNPGDVSYMSQSQGTSAAEDQEVYAESDSDVWSANNNY